MAGAISSLLFGRGDTPGAKPVDGQVRGESGIRANAACFPDREGTEHGDARAGESAQKKRSSFLPLLRLILYFGAVSTHREPERFQNLKVPETPTVLGRTRNPWRMKSWVGRWITVSLSNRLRAKSDRSNAPFVRPTLRLTTE